MVAEDFDYVRGLQSPLSEVMTDFGHDRRIPACVDRLVDPPSRAHYGGRSLGPVDLKGKGEIELVECRANQ